MLLQGKVSRKVVQNLSFYTENPQFLCFFGENEPQKRSFYVFQISRMRVLVEGTWTIFASKSRRVKG